MKTTTTLKCGDCSHYDPKGRAERGGLIKPANGICRLHSFNTRPELSRCGGDDFAMSPAARWHAVIDPIAKFCTEAPGRKAAIIERMNLIAPADTGNPWSRQQVESYLHPNRENRYEPRLGAGLALLEAARQIINEAQAK
jgi:hypothetical protein